VSEWVPFDVEESARLDLFLRDRAGLGRRQVARLCAEGLVRRDGRVLDKGAEVRGGDRVEVEASALGPFLVPAPLEGLRVLHEDERWVIVDKPAGAPAHPLRPGEGGTVADGLAWLYPACAAASPDPREAGLVHRLDNGTSGAMLAARDRETWARLRAALAAERVVRRYRALVVGDPQEGEHAAAIDGQAASTTVRVIARGPGGADVECALRGGRRHQIRRHLADAGTPIAGDERYGAGGPRLWLHAARLEVDGRAVDAPLPAGWAEAAAGLGIGG
jgi:23S rRNA pseudouridine1911/1915/1917 synthase